MDISPVLVLPIVIVFLLILFDLFRVDRATLQQDSAPSSLLVSLSIVLGILLALIIAINLILFLSIIVIKELSRHSIFAFISIVTR